jgi:hypothetical protein
VVYEIRHTEQFAAAYESPESANQDVAAVNHTVLLAADLGVLANSVAPVAGEFPDNELPVESIAAGWIESVAGGAW